MKNFIYGMFSNVFGTGRKVDIKGNEEDGEN